MAKTRQQKEETVKSLSDNLASAKSAVFVDFEGLNVADTQDFRKACREQGLKYLVTKKTLLRLALDQGKFNEVDLSHFEKGVGTVFGFEDEVVPAQTVAKFAKDHEQIGILGGVMVESPDGERFIDQQTVITLSKLPTKDVVLGQVVGTLKAPINGFVNVLAGNIRGLVNALNAISEQKA